MNHVAATIKDKTFELFEFLKEKKTFTRTKRKVNS